MGENKNIKELDDFAKKYIKEIEENKPSLDFTASLMDKIALEKTATLPKQKPLISKKVGFLIVASILAIVFMPFKSSEKELLNLPEMDFSILNKFQISIIFDNLSISNTTFYAILFFGLMIFIQFVFLKNHFNKRFLYYSKLYFL